MWKCCQRPSITFHYNEIEFSIKEYSLIFQERPERQIYRPGMGRFSSQTITKNDDDETDSTKTEDISKAQEEDELGGK